MDSGPPPRLRQPKRRPKRAANTAIGFAAGLGPGSIEPPDWFDEPMRLRWRWLVASCDAGGWGADVDHDALVMAVSLWAKWCAAERQVATRGVIVGSRKHRLRSPALKLSSDALRHLRSAMQDLGFAAALLGPPDVQGPRADQ